MGKIAYIDARVYYHPWNHYTTAVIGASCQLLGGAQKRVYLVTYEQSKSIFGSAEPIGSTLTIRSINPN